MTILCTHLGYSPLQTWWRPLQIMVHTGFVQHNSFAVIMQLSTALNCPFLQYTNMSPVKHQILQMRLPIIMAAFGPSCKWKGAGKSKYDFPPWNPHIGESAKGQWMKQWKLHWQYSFYRGLEQHYEQLCSNLLLLSQQELSLVLHLTKLMKRLLFY